MRVRDRPRKRAMDFNMGSGRSGGRRAADICPVVTFNCPQAVASSLERETMGEIGGPKKEQLKEQDELDYARKVKRNAEIDHDVSILRQKAAKKRKEAASTQEKVKKLELEAVQYDNRASDLERTRVF
jgi:hypothetical protein